MSALGADILLVFMFLCRSLEDQWDTNLSQNQHLVRSKTVLRLRPGAAEQGGWVAEPH